MSALPINAKIGKTTIIISEDTSAPGNIRAISEDFPDFIHIAAEVDWPFIQDALQMHLDRKWPGITIRPLSSVRDSFLVTNLNSRILSHVRRAEFVVVPPPIYSAP